MDERHHHAHRFPKVSGRYVRRRTGGYGVGRTGSMIDADDDVVAETAAVLRKAQGLNITYWRKLGDTRI